MDDRRTEPMPRGVILARLPFETAEDAGTVLAELFEAVQACRLTLRVPVPAPGGMGLPVVYERRAPGVQSVADQDGVLDVTRQPVPRALLAGRGLVVQEDCRSLNLGESFTRLTQVYGLRAQVVAAARWKGALLGVLSVHETRSPRAWSREDISRIRHACRRLAPKLHAVRAAGEV